MIKVTFEEGIDNITSEVGLYQWDTGQPLEIHGVSGIKGEPKIHFATKMSDTAYVVQSELTNGVIRCIIPDMVLTHGFQVIAFIYYEQGLDKKTIRTVTIPVTKRPKPNDWTETKPSEILSVTTFLEQVLSEVYNLNDRVNYLDFGARNKTTVFNADGSIIETTVDTVTTTVFHADGHITETIVGGSTTVVKNIYFDADGTIREVVS